MSSKTIVVLGGGVGGQVAAESLRARLAPEHRIILVDRTLQQSLAASFPWLMTGDRRPAAITKDLRYLSRRDIEVRKEEIQALVTDRQEVKTGAGLLNYDYLIIALGADLNPAAIPGMQEAAHTFYTLEGAVKLHDALPAFPGGRVVVVIAALPFKCPAAPYEAAMLLSDYFRKRGMREKVEMHVYTPEGLPMPTAGPELGQAVKEMVESQGIAFHPQHKLTAVDPAAGSLTFDNGAAAVYDLLVAIPPHRGPQVARESGLANESGWIPVDRATMQTKVGNVYAIGDVTTIPLPGRWKPESPLNLPKAGVFAHYQADVVAKRIAAEIEGHPAEAVFSGEGSCMLEMGHGKAGFASGHFYATPYPQVKMHTPGQAWHLGKVLFEQWWLAEGIKRDLLRLLISASGRAMGAPVTL